MNKEIIINGIVYIPKDSVKEYDLSNVVLIRSYAAGVHYGNIKKEEFTPSGKVVTLSNTRRIWYWDGAASLSQLALSGVTKPENCKISVEITENEIVNVIETIPMTQKAVENLNNIQPWKV